MTRTLTLQIIDRLDGRPIRLSSPYAEGQLLSITKDGDISLEDSGAENFDQFWSLKRVGNGFEIISSKYGLKICHNPRNGGIVTAIKHATSKERGCIWYISEEGEIYQPDPQGGERYLWLAGSHLYVTRDGFIADKWAAFFAGDRLPSPVGPQYPIWVIIILVVILAVYMLKK